jgi:hypothetical protein
MNSTRCAPILFAALLALLASACSTLPPSQNEKRIERLVAELDAADEERLLELSALPFLLDGETVAREADLRALWRNLRAAGFSFAGAEIVGIAENGPESYKAFGDDPEVMAFFKKHGGKDSATVTLKTPRGTFLILTGGKVGRIAGIPRIHGFTRTEGK